MTILDHFPGCRGSAWGGEGAGVLAIYATVACCETTGYYVAYNTWPVKVSYSLQVPNKDLFISF